MSYKSCVAYFSHPHIEVAEGTQIVCIAPYAASSSHSPSSNPNPDPDRLHFAFAHLALLPSGASASSRHYAVLYSKATYRQTYQAGPRLTPVVPPTLSPVHPVPCGVHHTSIAQAHTHLMHTQLVPCCRHRLSVGYLGMGCGQRIDKRVRVPLRVAIQNDTRCDILSAHFYNLLSVV